MVYKFALYRSIVQCEPLQVGLIQSSEFDKMNISHGDGNKRYSLRLKQQQGLPTENGGWNQQEKKKTFFIISVRKLFNRILQYVVIKNSQRNIFIFYLQIDWLFFANRLNGRERSSAYNPLEMKKRLNRHNLNFCRLSKSTVLTVADDVFKYSKTLPKQTQLQTDSQSSLLLLFNPADTISSHFVNLLPFWLKRSSTYFDKNSVLFPALIFSEYIEDY